MNKQHQHFIWDFFKLGVSIGLAILAFIVTRIWAENLAFKGETVLVAVATKNITAPQILTDKDLKLAPFRRDSLPNGAVVEQNFKKLFNVTLISSVGENEIITERDVIGNLDPELGGFNVPSNAKGFMIPANWLNSPMPKVKHGDTIAIIFSQAVDKNDMKSGILAEGVPVLNVDKNSEGNVAGIFVAVDNQLALDLMKLRVGNYQMAILVDGLASESKIFTK